jgi:RHS repeat-associated protein
LESAAFGGGRLTPGRAILYVTDYLGSVRAVVNGATGAICKASDYSAFGAESDVASVQKISAPLGTTFRDAYTGKEDQHPDFGTGYTDFGARQYSPALRRWMTTDPLSEKYYGISPYAFCNNNPVNFVDPDGSYIAEKNIQLWNLNKQKITNKVSALQNRVSRLEHKGKSEVRIGQLNDRINGLQQTLSVMSTLEASNNGYVISSIDGTLGGVTLDIEKNLIKIDYTKGSVGSFIHEVTHAGQFEAGELAFNPTNGSTYAQDIFDEIAAYKAQKDYVGGKPIRYTKEYLYSLKDPYTGLPLYAPGGLCNTAQFYITTKTSYSVVLMAYTGKLTSDNRPFYQARKMFYKHKGIQ